MTISIRRRAVQNRTSYFSAATIARRSQLLQSILLERQPQSGDRFIRGLAGLVQFGAAIATKIKVNRDPHSTLIGRPKDKGGVAHFLRTGVNKLGESGVHDPLDQGAVVDVGVRLVILAVLRKASVSQFFD